MKGTTDTGCFFFKAAEPGPAWRLKGKNRETSLILFYFFTALIAVNDYILAHRHVP
jgi:hypothetical protein